MSGTVYDTEKYTAVAEYTDINGEFPNFGCSKYTLKNGDTIEWIYTCESGGDIGAAE